MVLTTPVIRCVKQQLAGEVEVHYLTKASFSSILEVNPHLTKVHSIKQDVAEVMDELKQLSFDYVIDLHHNIRSNLVKRQLKMLTMTVNKINWQKWLMVNFKIDRLPDLHIVDRYMDTVKALGVENDDKGLDYFIPKEQEVELSSLPETHRGGYIAFAIGAMHETKKLPAEKIISICKKLEHPVILLGGIEDAETGDQIKAMAGAHVYNGCGQYSINQSASLIRQAKSVITHDTGMMHIAAAFKKNIVSVWGNTIPAFGMSPYLPEGEGRSTIVQVQGLRCRPCSKLGHTKCPKKHFHCMNLIDEEEIVRAL